MWKIFSVALLVFVVALYFDTFGDNFDPQSVADKRVLITGASSGIGEQLAYEYSKLGARVVIVARREQRLQAVAKRCRELGARLAVPVVADLGSAPARHLVMIAVERHLGGLDQLIANHAVMPVGLWLGTADNMTDLAKVLDINFVSFVDLASQALPMLMRSRGSIGVVSSVMGKFAAPGISSYCTSKFAVTGFFSSLRQEQEYRRTGVSVTTCIMGPVATDIILLTPEQKRRAEEMWIDVRAAPEDAAVAILRGVTTRQPEIYFSKISSFLVYLHLWFPRWIESLIGQYTFELAST